MKLIEYIYIDKEGIDSLVSQVTSELVESVRVEVSNRRAGAISGKVGLSDIMKEFMAADAGISGETESVRVTEIVATQPYEAKIDMLVQYIANHGGLLTNRLAICQNKEFSGFVYLTLPFTAPQYHSDWLETVHVMKQSGYFTLRNGLLPGEYNSDDSYYKSNKFDHHVILMNMNIQKMTTSLSMTSHLAVWIRAMGGNDLDLGVFGRVRQLADSLYQIKPYAVWRI